MSKPEDISQEAWDRAHVIAKSYCGCAPGRHRLNGTAHADSCWDQTEMIARAILGAKAEERRECLNIIEEVSGTLVGTGDAKTALGHVHSAIRKRGS